MEREGAEGGEGRGCDEGGREGSRGDWGGGEEMRRKEDRRWEEGGRRGGGGRGREWEGGERGGGRRGGGGEGEGGGGRGRGEGKGGREEGEEGEEEGGGRGRGRGGRVEGGGTGLALQLGHRASEDFDFFSSSGFDPDRLRSRLPFLKDLDLADPEVGVHRKRDNLEAFVHRAGGVVKVAFFGGLDTLQRVENPSRAMGSRVQVASLVDLAGMKMRVIQVRGSWKDYVDIHALASHGIDVPTGLAAARAIDRTFDPLISLRALQFYGDGTLDQVPPAIQRDLTRWAQAAEPAKLPALSSRRGLSPGGRER